MLPPREQRLLLLKAMTMVMAREVDKVLALLLMVVVIVTVGAAEKALRAFSHGRLCGVPVRRLPWPSTTARATRLRDPWVMRPCECAS